MFAVIKTGGKQYKVAKDDIIKVEKLDSAAGDTVELTDVLMVGNETAQTTGTPFIEGATVAAEVLEQARAKKVIIFKKKRRKDYRRTKGHRQHLTVLRITDILTDGKKPAKRAAAKTPAPKVAETADDAPKAAEAKKPAAKEPTAKPAAKADDAPKAAETKKPAAKASDTKKPAAKKPAAKKPAAKASAAKKPAAKKPAAKRAPAKKPAAPKSKE